MKRQRRVSMRLRWSPACPRWRTTLGIAALALVSLGPDLGVAQVEVSPYAGLYVPTAVLGDRPFGLTETLDWQHRTAASIGGRLTVWITDRLGVETAVSYAPSDIQSGRVPVVSPLNATVVTGTARALWRFARARALDWHLLGGLGVVSRSGRVYDSPAVRGTTDVTAVVGFGLRVRLGDHVLLRYDLEDYAYSAELDVGSSSMGTHLQNDLLFTQALTLEF